MYHRHRILDGDRLSAAGLQVKLGAAQTRQNKGLFRRQQVRAVELGADVNAELKVAHRRESAFVIRHRHGEVAPEADQGFGVASDHGLQRLHRIVTMMPRRRDPHHPLQAVEEGRSGFFADPDGAVSLHV
ncbi:hypothetical protein SB00610_04090 [Klebsiella quasipneumoniae subsp. similipneumoniae]|nr:hypothetical protein SB00610_04090 [Klebsiella quasipneumoniae subsp. similipneumoniae]